MRRLILLTVLMILALSVGLVAAQDMGDVDPSGQTIVYWHQYQTDRAQGMAITKIVDDFNANNEYGITVQAEYIGSYNPIQEQMEAAIQSGELPNLVAAYANAAASWALDGFAVDMMPYYNDPVWGFSDEDKADLNQGIIAVDTLNYGDFDNFLVAWPNQISGQLLVINTTLADEVGIPVPPKTMDDLMALSCAVAGTTTEDGTPREGFGFSGGASEYEDFLVAGGGSFIDENGAYDYTTPENIAVLQFYKDMYDEGCGYFSDQSYGWSADFTVGLNVAFLNSTAGLTYILDPMKEAGYEADWIVTTLPHGDGPETIQLFVPSIAMPPSTPEKQLASWIFLKYLAQADNQAYWSTGTGYYPLRKSATENLSKDTFTRPDIFDRYMIGLNALNNPDIVVYSSPPFASYSTARGLVAEAIANVTVNGMDVNEAAQQLTDDANEAAAELE